MSASHWNRGDSPASSLAAAGAWVLCSGAAGLAHQWLWTRRVIDVIGASADSFARVVGAFFLGLALGGAWAALTPATSRPWRTAARAEFAVAALSLPVLFAHEWVLPWLAGTTHADILRWLLPLMLIVPPALAMGRVLPAVLSAPHLSAGPGNGSPRATLLYGLNTAGGFAGILAAVAASQSPSGLHQTGLACAGVNLALALSATLLDATSTRGSPTTSPLARTSGLPSIPPTWLILSFASGFLVLAQEVILQHQFAQVTINSQFSGALVLGGVIVSLGFSALLLAALSARGGTRHPSIGLMLFAAALATTLEPFLFHQIQPGLSIIPYELPLPSYAFQVARLAAVTVVPVFLMGGLIFPALMQPTDRDGESTGRKVAALLAVNGIGGWAGAELAQAWIAPTFGLWGSMPALAIVYVLLGTLPTPGNDGRPCRVSPWIGLAFLLAAGIQPMTRAARRLPQVSIAPGETAIRTAVDREGVVTVVKQAGDDWRILFNNTYTLGGSRAAANQERQAHLPLLLHGHPHSVALLGVATGSTLAGAARHPGVHRVEAAELSAQVIRAAHDYFQAFNHGVFTNPHVHVRHEDARWEMLRARDRHDVVIGDLFLPWRTGEGRLYSREHFRSIRASLRPGGLFCQWLPLFQLTRAQFDTIARTFVAEFPGAFLIRGDFYAELPIVGLIGGRRLEDVDWSEVDAACQRLRSAGVTADPLIRHAAGVAMTVLGPVPPPAAGPLNTLGNAWLEWDAGRNIIGLRQPWFVGIPWAEYAREIHRTGAARLPARLQSAHDSGQFFLTLEIAAKLKLDVLDNLKGQIRDRLPPELLGDPDAAWSQWPMRLKPDPKP